MKTVLRYCPTCKIITLQAKRHPDLGIFSCHPDTLYWCANCNEQNYDVMIIAPFPEYYEGKTKVIFTNMPPKTTKRETK